MTPSAAGGVDETIAFPARWVRSVKMKTTCCWFLALFMLLALAPTIHATLLDANVIGMFPTNVAEFGYIDLEQARQFPWFAQFRLQVLPPRFVELESFLAVANVNPSTQISALAWAQISESADRAHAAVSEAGQIVGVALGHFDPDSMRAALQASKRDGVQSGGYVLYSCGGICDGLSFVILDSEKLAFGQPNALQALLDARDGGADSVLQETAILESINQANGQGIFWSVVDPRGARQAIRRIVPEAAQFPKAAQLLDGIKSLTIIADGSDAVDGEFQLFAGSPDDAAMLGQLVQAALVARQYAAKQSASTWTDVLDTVQVAQTGAELRITLSAKEGQMIGLIQSGMFSNSAH